MDLTTKQHTNSSFGNRSRQNDQQVFTKKQKYNPVLKTFTNKATDTMDDYKDVKATFALDRQNKEHEVTLYYL